MERVCSNCKISKDLNEFHSAKGQKYNKRYECKNCINKKNRIKKKSNMIIASVIDLPNEIWKNIDGYEDRYMLSNLGRIKVKERMAVSKDNANIIYYESLKLNTLNKKSGYYICTLYNDTGHKSFLIHRLIAIYFIKNPLNYCRVNHINSIRNDNRIENLEWCSNRENVLHGFIKGSSRKPKTSKYAGVSFDKVNNRWRAMIYLTELKKQKALGTFLTEEDAYAAYLSANKEHNIVNKYIQV